MKNLLFFFIALVVIFLMAILPRRTAISIGKWYLRVDSKDIYDKRHVVITDSHYIAQELKRECDVDVTIHWSWWRLKFMYHIVFKNLNAK